MKQKKKVRSAMNTLLMFGMFLVFFATLSCKGGTTGPDSNKVIENGEVSKVTMKRATWEKSKGNPIKVLLDSAPTSDIVPADIEVWANSTVPKSRNRNIKMTVKSLKAKTGKIKPSAGESVTLEVLVQDQHNVKKLNDITFDLIVEIKEAPAKFTKVEIKEKTGSKVIKTVTGGELNAATGPAGLSVELEPEMHDKELMFVGTTEPAGAIVTWSDNANISIKFQNTAPKVVTAIVKKDAQATAKTDYKFTVTVKKALPSKEDAVITKVVMLDKTWTGNAPSDAIKIVLDTPPAQAISKDSITEIKAKGAKTATLTDVAMTVKSITPKNSGSAQPQQGQSSVFTVVAEDKNNPSKLNDATFEITVDVKPAETAPTLTSLTIKDKDGDGGVLNVTQDQITKAKGATAGEMLELPYDKASGKMVYFEAVASPADALIEFSDANLERSKTGVKFTTAEQEIIVTVKDKTKNTLQSVYKFKVKVKEGRIATVSSITLGSIHELTAEEITKAAEETGFTYKFYSNQGALDITATHAESTGITIQYNLDAVTNQDQFGDAKNFTPDVAEKTVKIKVTKVDCTPLIYTLKLSKATHKKSELEWIQIKDETHKLTALDMEKAKTDEGFALTLKDADIASAVITWADGSAGKPDSLKISVKKSGDSSFGNETEELKDAMTSDIIKTQSPNSSTSPLFEVKIVVKEGDGAGDKTTTYLLKIKIEA